MYCCTLAFSNKELVFFKGLLASPRFTFEIRARRKEGKRCCAAIKIVPLLNEYVHRRSVAMHNWRCTRLIHPPTGTSTTFDYAKSTKRIYGRYTRYAHENAGDMYCWHFNDVQT